MHSGTVSVTKEDIRCGVSTFGRCPIAMAVRRYTGYKFVFVDENVVVCGTKTPFERYGVNKQMQEFINAFDSGATVEPFSFLLVENTVERK